MAQPFVGQHHRVGHDVGLQVLARVLLVRAHRVVAHVARHLRALEVRRQVAAAVRAAHLQVRELVEGAVEDQPRKEVRRLERVTDDVADVAARLPRRVLDDVVGAARMHEDDDAQLVRLGPERIELRIRQRLAVDVAADRRAAQPELLDAVLELLRREVRELQRNR